MQSRFEGSLMTSLAELRRIEEDRIAAEQAAIVAEAEARRRAVEDAERRTREAEEARVAAERAEAIRIVREREQAEREARMHVEAHEAAERARLAAALEAERTAQELELRRQEVAKKRPTWMVAVTIGAVIAAAALTWFGFERYQAAQAAQAAETKARHEKEAAEQEKQKLEQDLAAMQTELDDLDGKVGKAIDQIVATNDAVARAAAKTELERLRKQEADLQDRRRKKQEELERKKRLGGAHFSDECTKNAYSKACAP